MPRAVQSSQARIDLIEIGLYIARDNPAAANRLVDTLESKYELLASAPGMGESRPDLLPDLHSFTVKSYVIYYREIPDGIEVVRVLHGARDAAAVFRRK